MKKGTFIAAIIFLLGVACWLVFSGCTTLGIADRQTMMQKWQGKEKDVELLADINVVWAEEALLSTWGVEGVEAW